MKRIQPFFSLLSLILSPATASSVLYPRDKPGITGWGPCEEYVNQDAELPVICANISVPLDYTSPDSNATHTLELVKLAAEKSPSKGTIIMNFGGSGADGLHTFASGASVYQK